MQFGGDQALSILAPGDPKVTRIGCATSISTDAIDSTISAGASGLTYNTANDQYTYVWKTSKSWAGVFYRLELGLNDGSRHTFDIAFLK